MTDEYMRSVIDGHLIRIVRPLPSLVLEMARALTMVAPSCSPVRDKCPVLARRCRLQAAGEQLLEPERALPRAG